MTQCTVETDGSSRGVAKHLCEADGDEGTKVACRKSGVRILEAYIFSSSPSTISLTRDSHFLPIQPRNPNPQQKRRPHNQRNPIHPHHNPIPPLPHPRTPKLPGPHLRPSCIPRAQITQKQRKHNSAPHLHVMRAAQHERFHDAEAEVCGGELVVGDLRGGRVVCRRGHVGEVVSGEEV